ncbi:hypothetical protein Dimus_003553 [Dionaea muscipula]
MRSRRLGHLCDLDPEIERTLRSIRAKRRLEFNTQNQKEMEDPHPTANHIPAANGAANQRPLHEYAAPHVNGALPDRLLALRELLPGGGCLAGSSGRGDVGLGEEEIWWCRCSRRSGQWWRAGRDPSSRPSYVCYDGGWAAAMEGSRWVMCAAVEEAWPAIDGYAWAERRWSSPVNACRRLA